MKKKLTMTVVALAFGGLGSVALAAPTPMTEAQMDRVTAGALVNLAVVAPVQTNTSTQTGVALFGNVRQDSRQENRIGNIDIDQSNTVYKKWIKFGGCRLCPGGA